MEDPRILFSGTTCMMQLDIFFYVVHIFRFNRNYINEADFEKPRASPLLYKSFNRCPPALIIMAELDMNRDHGYGK